MDLDLTADLHRYLQQSRERMLASLDGLSEYDVRRPMTPTATNLLGLVKHLTAIEFGYLGHCVGRPAPARLAWLAADAPANSDMWATAEESRADLVELYRTAWRHSDESVESLGLAAPASVSWWPEERRTTTLGSLVIRVTAETAQHAGHADIVRELIDGQAGRDHSRVGDAAWWTGYVEQVQQAADRHRG